MKSSENKLFPVLEEALRAATEPLDAQALFDMASVKEHAASVNRVSDYLGNMWRKGLVVRYPAPKVANSRSVWTYQWKGSRAPKIYQDFDGEYTPKIIVDRPSVLITEEGSVMTLEFPHLIIQIKQKVKK